MLDYRVNDSAPLQTVFSEDIMNSYIKFFNFLWRLKKVENSLSNSFRLNMAHNSKFAQIRGMKDKFHKFNLFHHEMVHFIQNIHNYIMVEVLESAWKEFQDNIKECKDFD